MHRASIALGGRRTSRIAGSSNAARSLSSLPPASGLSNGAIAGGLAVFVTSVFAYTLRQLTKVDDLGPEFNEKKPMN